MIKVSFLCLLEMVFRVHLVLTMWEGDLEGLGGVSEVPHGQAAVRVAAHELLAFVMPAH